jgi:hypothetical protein
VFSKLFPSVEIRASWSLQNLHGTAFCETRPLTDA